MRFYNVEMKGRFIVQNVASGPSHSASDEGRLTYYNDDVYINDSTSQSKIWSESNLSDLIDCVESHGNFARVDADNIFACNNTFNDTSHFYCNAVFYCTAEFKKFVRFDEDVDFHKCVRHYEGTYMYSDNTSIPTLSVVGETNTGIHITNDSTSEPALSTCANGTSPAIHAHSCYYDAIRTHSYTKAGIASSSEKCIGVYACSDCYFGIVAHSGWCVPIYACTTNNIGILSLVSGTGAAIRGCSGASPAIFGSSTSCFSVYGCSASCVGVFGCSPSGCAVAGVSQTSMGVYAASNSSIGVCASSSSCIAIHATSSTGGGIYAITGGTGKYGVYGDGGPASIGVVGCGSIGVCGLGGTNGVYGCGGTNGVYGCGPVGVRGDGTTLGIYGDGTIGVCGNGTTHGVRGCGAIGVHGCGATGVCGYATGAGSAVSGNTAYCNSSSKFLKHLSNICLTQCVKDTPLKVYKYYWEDSNYIGFNQTIGPVAEEFNKTFNIDNSADGVNYDGIWTVDGIAFGLSLENIQEIDKLKQIVSKLYGCIQKLEGV